MHCLIYEISFLGERESIIEQKPIFFFYVYLSRKNRWMGGAYQNLQDMAVSGEEGKKSYCGYRNFVFYKNVRYLFLRFLFFYYQEKVRPQRKFKGMVNWQVLFPFDFVSF